jgi:hypothetical protein
MCCLLPCVIIVAQWLLSNLGAAERREWLERINNKDQFSALNTAPLFNVRHAVSQEQCLSSFVFRCGIAPHSNTVFCIHSTPRVHQPLALKRRRAFRKINLRPSQAPDSIRASGERLVVSIANNGATILSANPLLTFSSIPHTTIIIEPPASLPRLELTCTTRLKWR